MNNRYLMWAIGLHLAILLIVIVSVYWHSSQPAVLSNSPSIIHATAISQQPLSQPLPQPNTQQQQQRLIAQHQAEMKQQQAEKAQQAKIAAQQKAIAMQQMVAAQHAAQVKQQQAEKAQQAKVVAQQKAAKMQQQKKLAQQQKALQAQQEKVAAQKLQQEAAQELKNQMIAEQKQMQDLKQQQQQMQGVIDKYRALIQQAIQQHWIVPDGVMNKTMAILAIRLAPDGTVISVNIVKSSGNDALDRSAIAAVYKAQPLPLPNDATLFNNFRNLELTVKPQQ